MGTFTLLFSLDFMIYLAGAVVTGIRRLHGRIVRETIMRLVTLIFSVLVGNTIAAIHFERPSIAFVALYGAAPCLGLTYF